MKYFLTLLVIVTSYFSSAQQLPQFSYSADSLSGITEDRKTRMVEALKDFVAVMNYQEFQDSILKYTFKYDVPNDPNATLTTRQAVEKLFAGKEHYRAVIDTTANIFWVIKEKKKPAGRHPSIGYGYPSGKIIYTYTWFFDDEDNIYDLVGHIAHEWSHKIGFDHLSDPHKDRPKTVPYAFGYIVAYYAARINQHVWVNNDRVSILKCSQITTPNKKGAIRKVNR